MGAAASSRPTPEDSTRSAGATTLPVSRVAGAWIVSAPFEAATNCVLADAWRVSCRPPAVMAPPPGASTSPAAAFIAKGADPSAVRSWPPITAFPWISTLA